MTKSTNICPRQLALQVGSHRRRLHQPLRRNLQGPCPRRRSRASRRKSPSRRSQSIARHPSLPRCAVRPLLFPLSPISLLLSLPTPAPTANTFSGPTATTAVCAPKTTLSTAASPRAPPRPSAPSPVPHTPLAPAALPSTPLRAPQLITPTSRVMLPTRTRTNLGTKVLMDLPCRLPRFDLRLWRRGLVS